MSKLPQQNTHVPALLRQIQPVVERLPQIDYVERRWGEIDSYGANWMPTRRVRSGRWHSA